MPVGPSILWPLKAMKSAPQARTSVGKCGNALGGVDQRPRSDALRRSANLSDRRHGSQHVRSGGERDHFGARVQ